MTPRYITYKAGGHSDDEQRMEFDSDRNDDPGRELQLDRSFDDWVADSIEDQTSRQLEITNVPNENVIDVGEDMDEG